MDRDLLVIERKTNDALSDSLLAEGYSLCVEETSAAALRALEQFKITHAVILNAPSLRSSGTRTCLSIKQSEPELPIIAVSDQTKPRHADSLVGPGATIRTLVNRIELYSPLEKKKCLRFGDIYLDAAKQRVITPTGIAHLSTKGLQILRYLIKKEGALVSREELFKQVLKTSYVGDLNTLYTNISFLRNAIEPDPGAPRFLITVRGEGYKLCEGRRTEKGQS